MIIKLQNKWPATVKISAIKAHVLSNAHRMIRLCGLSGQDLVINKKIKKITGLELKNACHIVLMHTDFSFNDRNEIIITFKTKQIENLAKLITYGDGSCMGSDMLLKVLQ